MRPQVCFARRNYLIQLQLFLLKVIPLCGKYNPNTIILVIIKKLILLPYNFVRFFLAEAVRFELTVPCDTPVFKTGALNHYATPPTILLTSMLYENLFLPQPSFSLQYRKYKKFPKLQKYSISEAP